MKLTLSRRGDYVVRAAICLARAHGRDEPRKLREIAGEMEIPRTFVSQILGDLVRANLATSSFGRDGGYRLARAPEAVTMLEVVEAGEGPLVPDRCAMRDGPCRWDDVCPLHETWGVATAALRGELAATTLAEVAERDRLIEQGAYSVPPTSHRAGSVSVEVTDSVHVEAPMREAARRLETSATWLTELAIRASDDEHLVRVGPRWITKTVAVRLGDLVEGDDGAVSISLEWDATGPSGLFPHLRGRLRLAEVDEERSELTLAGRYSPPFGKAGMALDDAMLSRVARSTVRSFLRRVAHAIEGDPKERVGTVRAE